MFRGLLVVTTLFSVSVFAQSPGSITGKVVLPGGGAVTQSLRISLETLRGVKSAVYTDNQGAFAFRGLTPGIYSVIVDGDKLLWETTSVNVEVFPGAPSILTITLKEKKRSSTKTKNGDSVSAGELATDIPAKAKKEFDRASDASRDGKSDEAIAHLRKAIEYFPNYLMAHNDLGAQLLEAGKLDEAEKELRKAIEIDPKAFNPQLNLGIVLVTMRRYSEAREVLSKAQTLEPNSPPVRFYLAETFEGTNELNSAIREFTAAYDLGGPPFAVALFHLANVYVKIGNRELALKLLERYVNEAPKDANVPQARRLIAQLRTN